MTQSIMQITNGPMKQNCYIVSKDGYALIIDPGSEDERIITEIENNKLQPIAILNTHAHFDHIGAVEIIRKRYNIPFFLSNADLPLMRRANLYRLIFNGETNVTVPTEVCSVIDLRIANLDPFEVQVIDTPGHTEGGMSFVIGDALFTGDTLMGNGPGRSDLPGGNKDDLARSLDEYHALSQNLTVYAGHGRPLSLADALRIGSEETS